MKGRALIPVFTEHIPAEPEPGTLYVSMPFATAVHLCACGCGSKVVTPFGPHDWIMTFDGTVTLRPSVGNGQQPCRSHYYLRSNRIQWLPPISAASSRAAGVHDRAAHLEASTPRSPTEEVSWWRRLGVWMRNRLRRLRSTG